MELNSRRKACDTCHKKKIKCDMAIPVCSNCQLYQSRCTTTVQRRRPPRAARREPAPAPAPATAVVATGLSSSPQVEGSPTQQQDSLQAQLNRIESKLDSIGASSNILSPFTSLTTKRSEGSSSVSTRSDAGTSSGDSLLGYVDGVSLFPGDAVSRKPETPAAAFQLHDMHEILPVVEAYFRDYNSAVPLFHQASFMRLLHDFDSGARGSSSRVAWGAINCVLAIGYRIDSIDADPVRKAVAAEKSVNCVSNIQGVLDDMIMWDEDTLGLQGVLAMVILFQSSSTHKRASMLISIAVRMAHRLNLNNRSSHSAFSPVDARQRDNIFWICYWLDKDVSVRAKTASFQLDSDMDLDLPGSGSAATEGELCSLDGLSRFNYFRARVQLAHIQGRIYDTLYSVRSKRLTSEERMEQVRQLDTMLDEWYRSIPTALQVEHMSQSLATAAASHMILLHHHYLLCLVFIHGLYSLESEWLKALGAFSRAVLEQADNNTDICMSHMKPPLPSAWARCTTAARGSIRLFLAEKISTCNIWLNLWAYFSALIILLANCQYFPTGDFLVQDLKIAKEGVQQLSRTVKSKEDKHLDQLMGVLHSLEKVVDKTVGYYQKNPEATPYPPQGTPYFSSPGTLIDTSGFGLEGHEEITADLPAFSSAWPEDPMLASLDFDFAGFDSFSEGGGLSGSKASLF